MPYLLEKLIPSSLKSYLWDFHALLKSYLKELQSLRNRVGRFETLMTHFEAAFDVLLGAPTDFLSPEVGFNGQTSRKEIFRELLYLLEVRFIVETRAYTGLTTGYMRQASGLEVIAAEVNPRFYLVIKQRLAGLDGISLANKDSRKFLLGLAQNPSLTEATTVFYLDAHMDGDFPLLEEIGLIAQHWREFAILIDDFQVPGDRGFGYADYGDGKALTLDYVQPALKRYGLVPFFPSVSSSKETGSKRGCVVLVSRGECEKKVEKLTVLRKYYK